MTSNSDSTMTLRRSGRTDFVRSFSFTTSLLVLPILVRRCFRSLYVFLSSTFLSSGSYSRVHLTRSLRFNPNQEMSQCLVDDTRPWMIQVLPTRSLRVEDERLQVTLSLMVKFTMSPFFLFLLTKKSCSRVIWYRMAVLDRMIYKPHLC